MADGSSSFDAYIRGSYETESLVYAYLAGGGTDLDSVPAFLTGDIAVDDSLAAYLDGQGSGLSATYAYLFGILRDSFSAYLEGSNTGDDDVANDYIILRNSDNSVEKKFRVLAQDYDDGTSEKAETMKRTIGGGLSQSIGGIYKSWSPIIRVKHTETESGYGDLADLQYFFDLNNPQATPSNLITFIDHHNDSYTVVIPGSFQKAVLGSSIEGTEGHYLVRLRLQEKPNA